MDDRVALATHVMRSEPFICNVPEKFFFVLMKPDGESGLFRFNGSGSGHIRVPDFILLPGGVPPDEEIFTRRIKPEKVELPQWSNGCPQGLPTQHIIDVNSSDRWRLLDTRRCGLRIEGHGDAITFW